MQSKENVVEVSFFDRALYMLAALDADLFILGVMTSILVTAVISMGGQIRWFQASVGLPLSMMVSVLVVKFFFRRANSFRDAFLILRDWMPFLFISFIYENLHDVAKNAMSWDVAGYLYQIDVMIFGVEPTLWIQKYFSPLLTDLMAISYAQYFFLPLFIMFFLSVQNRRTEFRHMALTISFVFLIGFLCYVFLPANPPRYFITDLYSSPVKLYGLFLYDRLQSTWDGLSVISGGAFPSLHVGISTVALIYAYRLRGLSKFYACLWYVYIPLVISLWISTVYLRHHWFIDIVAGWAVAGFGFLLSNFFLEQWKKLR